MLAFLGYALAAVCYVFFLFLVIDYFSPKAIVISWNTTARAAGWLFSAFKWTLKWALLLLILLLVLTAAGWTVSFMPPTLVYVLIGVFIVCNFVRQVQQ